MSTNKRIAGSGKELLDTIWFNCINKSFDIFLTTTVNARLHVAKDIFIVKCVKIGICENRSLNCCDFFLNGVVDVVPLIHGEINAVSVKGSHNQM